MSHATYISRQLAPAEGRREILVGDAEQDTEKIIQAIQAEHKLGEKEYDKIANYFWRGNARDTANELFNFHKSHIKYDVEPEHDQTVKTPARILYDGKGDCKHYSLFTNGVCAALERKGHPITCSYRFVSETPDNDVHHVFAVIGDGYTQYWCDPVLDRFDQKMKFYNAKDWAMENKNGIGAISRLSGLGTFNFHEYFPHGQAVQTFLHHHGIHPHEFKSPEHMYEGLHRIVHHHRYTPHQVHALHENYMSGVAQALPLVGKYNVFKQIQHAVNVNTANVKKEVKKVEHGVAVNTQNFKKGVEIAAQQAKDIVLNVATAPARHAFLSLVAVNARSLATNLNRWQGKPQWNEIMKKWKHLGGDPNVLRRTITNGAKQKRLGSIGRHHPNYILLVVPTFTGHQLCGCSQIGAFGIDDATIAAWTALASAVLAVMKEFIHKPGNEGTESKAAEAKAITDGAAAIMANTYNAAKIADDPQGAASAAALEQLTTAGADNAAAMTVTPSINADGSPVVTVHDMSHPTTKEILADAGQNNGTDGGTPATPVNTASMLPTTTGDGPEKKDYFKEFADAVKKGWDKYHVPVLVGTGLVIAATQVVPKLMKKRRK